MYQNIKISKRTAIYSEGMETRTYFKKGFLLFLGVVSMLQVWSNPIDENTALKVAAQVLRPVVKQSSADETLQKSEEPLALKLLYKSSSSSNNKTENSDAMRMRTNQENVAEDVYFYIFVTEENDGFVIVAGDDRVVPVLGYSNENGFSVENMPDNLKWWLDGYARQIEYAIENNMEATPEIKQQWKQLLEDKESINDKK